MLRTAVTLGVGIRVVVGESAGYAHSDDLSDDALMQTAEAASLIARSAPAGQAGSSDLRAERVAALYHRDDAATVDPQRYVALLERADATARRCDARVVAVNAQLVDDVQEVWIATSEGRFVFDRRPLVTLGIQVVASDKKERGSGYVGDGGRTSIAYFDRETPEALASDAARIATVNLVASPAPAGEMEMIVGAGGGGVLLHEAVGHGLESDFNRRGTSLYSGRVGERVASDLVTIFDDGNLEEERGSLNVDDEGVPGQHKVLVENGVLRGYMQDRLNARLMGVESTGSGRRQSFRFSPQPRMCNTYMPDGDSSFDEILARRGAASTRSRSPADRSRSARATSSSWSVRVIWWRTARSRHRCATRRSSATDPTRCARWSRSATTAAWRAAITRAGRAANTCRSASACRRSRSRPSPSAARSMDEAAAIAPAQQALDAARACGAQSAEAAVSIARRLHVEARENAVARLEGSTGKGLLLRVFRDGRRATLSTSDFSAEGIAGAVRRAVAHAELVAADEYAGLPDRVGTDGENLSLCDPDIAERDSLEKIDEALRLERLIREADARVVNSSGSHYTDAIAVTALANSNGFAAGYAWTRVGRSTGPVALDGGVKRIAHYGTAARHQRDLEGLEAVATTAVRRAVDLFGARKPPTMRVPVIFERDVAASILDDVFAAVSSANVAVGNSWLTGRSEARSAATS